MKEFFRRTTKSFTPGERENDAQIPDDLWVKCSACGELIYKKQFIDNLKVCPKCGHHSRLRAREWLGLLDENSFEEHDADLWPQDPLGFVSLKETYADKLRSMQQRVGQPDAVIDGSGTVAGLPLIVAIADFEFMGASMGSVYGEKMTRAAERAAAEGVPLLTINTSGGARMQEGVVSLMQMAKISMALTRLANAQQPHFSLLVDPCYGGVMASYASVADVIIAEQGANIGFAGKRVIEQTLRQKLPPDFQKAEFMLQHGMVDVVAPRNDLRLLLSKLLRLHSQPRRVSAPAPETSELELVARPS